MGERPTWSAGGRVHRLCLRVPPAHFGGAVDDDDLYYFKLNMNMNAEEEALRRFLHYCYRSGVPDPLLLCLMMMFITIFAGD